MDQEVINFIEARVVRFNERRLDKLRGYNLRSLIRKKNPYLSPAKNIRTFEELARSMLDAALSSSEETMFGEVLEDVALLVASKYRGAWKSTASGIDLEFDLDTARVLISVKSGPAWGNSQQVKRMIANFNAAEKVLRQGGRVNHVRRINGCCYGYDPKQFHDGYEKICGQAFWELVSGDVAFHVWLVQPICEAAKRRSEEFVSSYYAVVNSVAKDLGNSFGTAGEIEWERISVECNAPRATQKASR